MFAFQIRVAERVWDNTFPMQKHFQISPLFMTMLDNVSHQHKFKILKTWFLLICNLYAFLSKNQSLGKSNRKSKLPFKITIFISTWEFHRAS